MDAKNAASILGKRGGSMKSDRKTASSRENGKRGGRPRRELLSRFTPTTVTMSEWRLNERGVIGNIRGVHTRELYIKTDATGDREWMVYAESLHGHDMHNRHNPYTQQYVLGSIIKVERVRGLSAPTIETIAACLTPGTILYVGLVHDGLWSICPKLAYAIVDKYPDGDVSNAHPDAYRVGVEAATIFAREGREAAVRHMGAHGYAEWLDPLGIPSANHRTFEVL